MPPVDQSPGVEPGPSSPGSMIVTFAGLYLRKAGGWIAVADLIKLLEVAGQSAAAVRQALVRLKSRGFLAAERQAGRAGYRLTERGLADLAVGDGRIFRYGESDESDGWVLAVFSVPEQARPERHRLRTQLAWLGFGTVSAGVWIAPATLATRAQQHIADCGLGAYVTWFSGRALRPDIDHWWDLDALGSLYRTFLRHWESAAEADDDADPDDLAMARYLTLVDEWRQFPRIDPGLPAALLPPHWPGRRAFEVFVRLQAVWSGPAERFALGQVGG